MYQIQQTLLNSTHLDFYTDGSVFDLSKESVNMGFSFIQTNNNSPYVEFQASIENWPSSSRTELAAIVAALLVSPKFSFINIFTDSDTIINQFNNTKNNILFTFSRHIFKETNNILWALLRSLIDTNNLQVSFHKVRAHSDDPFNNKVDRLAKTAIFDTVFSLNYTATNNIDYFPKWKNLYIETHLRHFLMTISHTRDFENWIQLN